MPTVKVTVKVEDESGKPIAGADAGVAGDLNTPKNGPVPRQGRGPTDQNGKFTMEVATVLGNIAVGARGKGYYDGHDGKGVEGTWLTTDNDARKTASKSGKWEPWEREIKVVLRPIKNPVPMYVKRVDSQLPAPGHWVGYDLEKGDWVAPHGKGAISDIEFRGDGEWKDWRNFDTKLTVRFPGKGDGILVVKDVKTFSAFKFPYEAPEEGYLSEYSWRSYRQAGQGRDGFDKYGQDTDLKQYYIFRVRSSSDNEGNVKGGLYGKILPPAMMKAGGEGNGYVSFIYYLNPSGTRNLEFDPKQNLFTEEKRTFGP